MHGRHAGWITAYAGVAAGAETIVVPERPVHVEELCGKLETLRAAGRRSAIIAASEGTRIFEGEEVLSSGQEGRVLAAT